MGKQIVLYSHNGILLGNEKEQTVLIYTTPWMNLNQIMLSEIREYKTSTCSLMYTEF